MLHSELLWATFASFIAIISCSNDFVTSKFPSQFEQGEAAEFYWDNLDGYIAGIRVYSTGDASDSSDSSDSSHDWILEPNCPDNDSESSCTAYANNGSAYFDGTLADGSQVALGSGYELILLWTDSKSYADIDDDPSEVKSPTFSIVPGTSEDEGSSGGGSGMSKGEKAGIAIAVILVVMFLTLVLWWRYRKERRRRRKNRKRNSERDEEKGDDDRRWISKGLGMKRETRESWSAVSSNLLEKPSPATASGSPKDGRKSSARLYLDDKAELASDPSSPRRASGSVRPEARSAPMVPVELPAEPMRGQDGAAWQSRTASTMFVYDPRPSYALRTPASQHAELNAVSPLSPNTDSDAAVGSLDDSVSPLTPISRKPVGGGVRAAPEGTR